MPAKKSAKPSKAISSHVLLGLPKRGQGSVTYQLRDRGPMPDGWWAVRSPPLLPIGDLVFVDQPYKGYASLLASKKPPQVLPTEYLGQLVLQAELAKQLGKLDGVEASPTELRDAKGNVAKGYTLLDVVALLPLDRGASKAKWTHGWLEKLQRAGWRDQASLPPIFRLLDHTGLLFVRRDIAQTLAAVGKVSFDDYENLPWPDFPPAWSMKSLDSVGSASKAEDAFWACFAGDKGARATALQDPWWAYAVAASIDRSTAADTRKAACRSPIVAALYATNVEVAAHPETRSAASKSGLATWRYATHLDYRLDPSLRPRVLRDGGHDEESLAEDEQSLEEVRRWMRGEAVEPKSVITRHDWPAPKAARYAEVGAGDKHTVVDSAVRSDIDAFVPRGYRRLGLEGEPGPDEVVDRVHRYVDQVQAGATKLGGKKDRVTAQMELGCAWGEQLHRALGWQWATVSGGPALISGDRALAHFPFQFVGRLIARGTRENTVALLFNMLAAGKTPAAKPGAYCPVS